MLEIEEFCLQVFRVHPESTGKAKKNTNVMRKRPDKKLLGRHYWP
jgi:hypothetical protein